MGAIGYSTDLSDAQWALIEPHLPPSRPGSQPAGGHQRDLLSVPDRLPVAAPAQGLSTLGNRLVVLSAMAPGRGLDRNPPRSLSSGTRQDGSATRAERRDHGCPVGKDDGKRGVRGFDGHKRVKGRKRHLLVDTLGLPIAGRVEPAGMSDRRAGARLVAGLSPLWPTIRIVIADAGHESRKLAAEIKRHEGWQLLIVKRSEPAFKIVGLNWIVERTFAWLGRYRRLAKDYEYRVQTSETLIQIAAVRLMLGRLAAP